jgi:hypothetical protein
MKRYVFGVVLLINVAILAVVVHSELLQSDETREASETRRTPRPSDPPHRVAPSNEGMRGFTPESHVPLRSPDLGSSYFPLSPSIGPGSSSLGPAAGPDASRRGSNTERELERNRSGRGSR